MPRNPRKKRIRKKGIRRFIGEKRKTHRPIRSILSKSIGLEREISGNNEVSNIVEARPTIYSPMVEMLTEADQGQEPPSKDKPPDGTAKTDFMSRQGSSSHTQNVHLCPPDSPFCGFDTSETESYVAALQTRRKPLRVLSLFDGIAAGAVALKNLGLTTEVYYACEIDNNALKVVKCHFPEIIQLGCVKSLSQVWDDLGRIDLILGGSPCNDISRVNPNRRLFNNPESSAFLFFDFVKTRDHFMNKGRENGSNCFWLFENTCHIDSFMLKNFNESLGCEPTMRCASEFVPMIRKRFYWSNIPISSDEKHKPTQRCSSNLGLFLKPHRQATVSVTGTLTTNSNSQRTGSRQEFPVTEDGTPSQLYITEIETLFSFPEHYTDCANLSVTARRRLLGKAWCVAVIEDLLSPLSLFFK